MVDRRNPWLVVLWMLAALLLAAGAWLGWQATLAPTGTGTDVVPVLVLPVVFASLAPWVLGAGVGALAGAVIAHATRRRA